MSTINPATLLTNCLVLQKGRAIYVSAGRRHRRVMDRSDIVHNTGFRSRGDQDSVDLFTSTLAFSPKSANDAILKLKSSDKGVNGHTKVMTLPMSEFDMLVTVLKGKENNMVKVL